MLAIIVMLVSFVSAVLGLFHSHAAAEGNRTIWGLTPLGLTLLTLSIIGMAGGVMKEIGTIRSGARAERWQGETTDLLKQVRADVLGIKEQVREPQVAAQLDRLADRLSAVASRSRGSDFSMSDFTNSNFRMGNFSGANFQQALFRHANLRGADLSTATIDDTTMLPTRR